MIGLECLAIAVFFEARDQNITGQQHVAQVIMNRVESDRWPNTICGVVFQDKQFSFTHDGLSDKIDTYSSKNIIDWKAALVARAVALQVYEGGDTQITSTHYHELSVSPSWAKHMKLDKRIGDHVFYTAPSGK